MTRPIVEIKKLSAGYDGNIVLRDVDLTIYSDDFLGIIGPNGGGKTTLVKIILGLIKPLSGQIVFADGSVRKNIGYMPQQHQIDRKFPILVSEVVASGLMGVGGMTKSERRLRVQSLMEEMGIASIADRTIGELSGGQMQRALLARAVASRPALLLLDEPNSYVDKRFEQFFYELLQQINRTTAIALVSHDIGTVVSNVKNIACVNETVHYHAGADIDGDWLEEHLACPLDLIAHGDLPHRVLKKH